MRARFLAGVAALALATPAAGQVDTTARDTTRAPADTAAPDTTAVLLPVLPATVPAGPLPIGTRYRFTRDSLLFSNIHTLSDLLAHLPGVYVARGGFYGQAEPVIYGGRGALALELYWDGVPYLPLGRDSVYLDPARVPLVPVELVDVLVLPGTLRVYLVTARQASTATHSAIGITTGELNIARYHAAFAHRWRSGVGLSLAGDDNRHEGLGSSSTTDFRSFDLWLKAEYVPSPRWGVAYQLLTSTWRRDSASGIVERRELERRDHVVRAFAARRDDELGTRAELVLAWTTADPGDPAIGRSTMAQQALTVGHRWPRAQVWIAGRLAGERRPFEAEASAAWTPLRFVTLAADARHSVFRADRTGQRVALRAGLALPLGLSAHGVAVWTETPAAAWIETDFAQETIDVEGAVRWSLSWATLEAGLGRRDPFAPTGVPDGLRSLTGLGPSLATRYVRAFGSVRPPFVAGVQLAGSYFHALDGPAADFEPPHHARLSAAFQSKFWRVFRSGIFTLRGELAAESWSQGLGGVESGSQLLLGGATFFEWNIEMQIGDVTLQWVMRNSNGMRASYVPGLGYPKTIQYYGARWTFRN